MTAAKKELIELTTVVLFASIVSFFVANKAIGSQIEKVMELPDLQKRSSTYIANRFSR